ncbi:MAG: prolipoprotein diacylglyceryl transferase [Acidobacteria bacterium]|nr:prolipoprotein diacylglyceryl transferase [Acidobacteriota bacterium]
MVIYDLYNKYFDRLASPEILCIRRPWHSFRLCGYAGLALAILMAMGFMTYRGLSPWIMAGIVMAAVLTFFGLVMATKIITGEERIIYYHHEIAVMVVAAVLLWLLGRPILPYLDLTILSIGIFLVCGRIGCFMVGCCHGRPSGFGICYREEHAAAGFTHYLVGVRLFPIQAVESCWVFCIVLVGGALVLRGRPPGEALAWYIVTYDLGRFCFEFMRGDPDRPYYRGFSQPQWISLILMVGVAWAEFFGILPFHTWHIGATIVLAVTMIAISVKRYLQKTAKYHLLHARHIREVAEAIILASNLEAHNAIVFGRDSAPVNIHLGYTSLGIQISSGEISGAAGVIGHYALSCRNGALSEEAARTLSKLILQLKRASGSMEFIKGNRGVFHLLIRPLSG